MKIAVIVQDKKFIVVVLHDSTVCDLKAEILRVYNALFPDSCPPPTISAIQTLSGCVLFEGYSVSSVLSDNDTVVALTDSSSDHTTTNPMVTLSGSPYFRPYYGISPEGHHCSPMFTPHAMLSNTTPQQHTNCGHSYMFPSFMEAPTTRLFQSPKSSEIRTVSIQCPSPERNSEDCLHPHHTDKENTNNVLSNASQYHSSTSQTVADVHLPQRGDMLSPSSDPDQGYVNTSTGTLSSDVQRSVSSKVVKRKQVRKHKSKAAPTGNKRTAVDANPSGSDTQTASAENERILKQPSTSLSSSGPASGITTLSVGITKEQSQHVPSAAASHTVKKSLPSKDRVSQTSSKRKRKLAEYNESDAKKVKSMRTVKKVAAKQKPKTQKIISPPDEDSSDWMSTDDGDTETDKRKVMTSSSGDNTTKSGTVDVDKAKKSKSRAAVSGDNSSTSEWESESECTVTLGTTPGGTGTITKTPLDKCQAKDIGSNAQGGAEKEISQASASVPPKVQSLSVEAKSLKKREVPDITDSSSSSEWSSDEDRDDGVASSVTAKGHPPQPVKKGKSETSGSKVHHNRGGKVAANDDGGGKTATGAAAKIIVGQADVHDTTKTADEESDHGRGQASKVLDSWSQTSSVSSPTKGAYTARDGQRLKKRRKHAHKSGLKTSESTEVSIKESPVTDPVKKDDSRSHDPTDTDSEVDGKPVELDNGTSHELATSVSNGDVLAQNSLTSNEEETAEVVSRPQDTTTVIQETQDSRDFSRSPSPEIPFIAPPVHSQHHSSKPNQKVQDDVTLKERSVLSSLADSEHALGNTVEDEQKDEGGQPVGTHTNSEREMVSEVPTSKHRTSKLSKNTATRNTFSGSGEEGSDVNVSPNKGQKRIHFSEHEFGGAHKSTLAVSHVSTDLPVSERAQRRSKKRKTQADKIASKSVEADVSVVPSSQTDTEIDSDSNSLAIVSNCTNHDNKLELSRTTSNSDESRKDTTEQSEHSGQEEDEHHASVSNSGQNKKKRKQKRKKNKQKGTSVTTTDKVPVETTSSEPSIDKAGRSSTTQLTKPILTVVVESGHPQSQGKNPRDEHLSTDTDKTECGSEVSDSSETTTQSFGKTKRHKKRKQGREDTTSQHKLEVINEEMSRGMSPTSVSDSDGQSMQPDSQKEKKSDHGTSTLSPKKDEPLTQHMIDEERHSVRTPAGSDRANTSLLTSGGRGKDGFLKPVTTPKSLKSPVQQLSPAAKITKPIKSENALSKGHHSEPKKTKGSSLLSIFSVTETEPSSEESSYEGAGSSGRAHLRHGKKPHKLNFLSSLGSHGKTPKPSRRTVPFSLRTLSTPSSSSSSSSSQHHFSSEAAMKMFSLSNTSRSAAAKRARLHSTPRLPKPSPNKRHTEKTAPSLGDLFKETVEEGGGEGDGKEPSLSELLADGSLWES